MNDEPVVMESNGIWAVVDRRRDRPGARLGFWGGVMMGGSSLACVLVPTLRRFEDMVGVVLVVAAFALGVLMLAAAGGSQERVVELARLEPGLGYVHVRPEASGLLPREGRSVNYEEVRHVVFGATRYPADQGKPEVKVEAFTVCLELEDGSILPVVEASTRRVETFRVADFLSRATGAPVLQAGLGV